MPRMYRTFFRSSLILACFLLAQVSRADGLYVGVGGYLTDIEVAAQSDDDITPAGFIGYQFLDTPIFMASVELGYYNLGSLSGRVLDQRFSADASATTLAGVAYLPIGPFIEIYGKLGAGRISVDGSIPGSSLGDNATEIFGGVGAAWDIFDTIDIYGEVLQFDNALDSRMVGVGIRFDFF
ncbi:MAG: outer membrane beta-barrel protein [Pseudomonadota bacterium]